MPFVYTYTKDSFYMYVLSRKEKRLYILEFYAWDLVKAHLKFHTLEKINRL